MLLLLVALAGLATLAKHSEYLPEANPTHFLSISAKMEAAHLPVLIVPGQACVLSELLSSRPTFRARRTVQREKLRFQEVDLSVSLQHRPPPFFLL
jgi:hypothetical protein